MQYCSMLFYCILVYLTFEATCSKQYLPQNASYEVSNTNNFGSVSNSLKRLAAAGECMSIYSYTSLPLRMCVMVHMLM